MSVDAYPLHWPHWFPRTDPAHRQRARFSKDGRALTVADSRSRVLREIAAFSRSGHTNRIPSDQVVISTDVPVRQDGLPYSGRKPPEDPGVAVYFELDGEPHVLPCDTWDRVADNMAAIAAHLGAMRGMERWGVGDLRAHFAGFTAIEHNPEPSWHEVLGCSPGASEAQVRSAYKAARARAHPDRGGSVERFNQVQRAWDEYQEMST